ncbi:FtsX-like permease family protein [Rubritalea spongiae]|uniref:FtsX-like permease family protein n=1 Tax=Rubritalea spongiae TaxID=430797 RepID=A0ABW5E005_9BACT
MTKNFSLLLALRYLNPLRTHVSVITLISLAGVALGVMVLLVVMSVMAGFENMVKDRVLGESPHITIVREMPWDMPNAEGEVESPEQQWRELETRMEGLPNVESAYPLVRDYVIAYLGESAIPVAMRGVDTQDQQAVEDLKKLEVAGDVDMGMGYVGGLDDADQAGEVAVVSSIFAEDHMLQVGDVLEVFSNRNIKQLKPLLERKGSPSVYERFAEDFVRARAHISEHWVEKDGKEQVLFSELQRFRGFVEELQFQNVRKGESDLLTKVVELTQSSEYDDDYNYYEIGRFKQLTDTLDELKNVDVEVLDREEDLQINELALPKDVRVAGIYRADRFAPGPPLLVPLHLAQELAGVGSSGAVNGVALRLKDPYLASQVLDSEVLPSVPAGWYPVTWMKAFEQQFALISMQKIMMTLALSFIMLIAIFSISAVMFTVTLQKKREIGVMKALGATPGQVTNVFAFQGVIVGFAGSLVGVAMSLLVLNNLGLIQGGLRSMGFDPFSQSFYGMDTLPYEINAVEMVLVSVGAFVLCALAAYAPAYVASRTDAAKSLRNL